MNTEQISSLLGGLYLFANLPCIAAYVPQIIRMRRNEQARLNTSVLMWWTWTLGGITELLYAGMVAHQVVWETVAASHVLACAVVAVISTQARIANATRRCEHEAVSTIPMRPMPAGALAALACVIGTKGGTS